MKHRHNLEDIHGFKLYTKLGRKKSTTRIVCTPLLLEFLKAAWWRTGPAFWKQEADDEVSKTTNATRLVKIHQAISPHHCKHICTPEQGLKLGLSLKNKRPFEDKN
jgi:hypothetical protein